MPPLGKPLGIVGKFAGSAASETAAFAAGAAISPALSPLLQKLRNETWAQYPDVPPDAYFLAEGVAQGQVDPKQAQSWAAEQGISSDVFAALVNVANTGPALGYAYEAWRRGFLTDTEFQTALKRTGLEPQWFDAMKELKTRLLEPGDLARAIHRGLIPDPGLLKGQLPQSVGNVPAYPVYPIDAIDSAAGYGYTRDELGVLVGLQGLPMGSHEAAQALFRGILTPDDYLRAIAEGNTRNEWADAIREQSRQIPSVVNYVEALVRGWITRDEYLAGVARHGMTPDDAQTLYLIHGRPITHSQAFIGYLRGGRVDGEDWDERETFRRSVIQSNIRPEWEPLLWAERYKFPPFFQTINALSKGWIDAKTATDWLLVQGYDPDAVQLIVGNVSGGGGTTGKKLTPSQIKSAYLNNQITRDDAIQRLTTDGYSAADAALLLGPVRASA